MIVVASDLFHIFEAKYDPNIPLFVCMLGCVYF